jgi:hypothetical protein
MMGPCKEAFQTIQTARMLVWTNDHWIGLCVVIDIIADGAGQFVDLIDHTF